MKSTGSKNKISADIFVELNMSPGLYAKYIRNILKAYGNSKQELYRISVNNFQKYVLARYHADKQYDDELKTINELFKAISPFPTQSKLIISEALVDIEFGDIRTKANRLANIILEYALEPNPNPAIYYFFERVLSYIYRSLHSSIILQSVRNTIYKYFDENSDNPVLQKSGIYALLTFVKKFSFCFENQTNKIQRIILRLFLSHDSEVLQLAGELLEAILTSPIRSCIFAIIPTIQKSLLIFSCSTCQGNILAAEILLEYFPDQKKEFKFKSVAFDKLDSSNEQEKLSALSLIPFQVRTTPELFDTARNIQFFTKIEPLLHKKEPNRNEALVSFGKFIFYQHAQYNEELKVIDRCKKSIMESLDSDQSIYALLAALIVRPSTFQQESAIIFQQPISSYLVNGIKSIIENNPSERTFILSNFMIMAEKIFLSDTFNLQSTILLFKSFIKLNIPNDLLTLSNAIQYSKFLYNPDLNLRKAVVNFLLYFNETNQSEAILLILLAYIGFEVDEYTRVDVIRHISQTKLTSPQIISSFYSLLTDPTRKVRQCAYSYIIQHLTEFEKISSINKFLNQSIRQMKESDRLLKTHLEIFSALSKAAFSEEKPRSINSQTSLSLLSCYSIFLIDRILNEPHQLFSDALEILSYLIQITSKNINLDKLVKHLDSALIVHSTHNQLTAALKLFLSAIRYTNLKNTIYNEHSYLIKNLIKLTKLKQIEISYDQLFECLAVVGPIDPALIAEKDEKSEQSLTSTFLFLAHSPYHHQADKLRFAAEGVAIGHILQILDTESMTTFHNDAVEALAQILSNERIAPELLSDSLVERIRKILRNHSMTTFKSILLDVQIFSAVLGDKFRPVVGDLIDFICERWNKNDSQQSLFITAIQHLLHFLPHSLDPYLTRLMTCITTGIETYPSNISSGIILLIESMETLVQKVDFIVYPALLSWVSVNSMDTQQLLKSLPTIKTIFAFGGTNKYAALIIRTMIELVSINKNLNDEAANILTVVAYHLHKSFLIYLPQIRKVFTLNETNLLTGLIDSYEGGMPIADTIRMFATPAQSGAIKRDGESHRNSFSIKMNDKIKLAPPTFEQHAPTFELTTRWQQWSDEFFSIVLVHSNSRAIQLCRKLTERNTILKESLLPISIALFLTDPPNPNIQNDLRRIFQAIIDDSNVPKVLARIFIDSIELCEILSIETRIQPALLYKQAIEVEKLAFALRYAEKIYKSGPPSRQNIENLFPINQQLGFSLSNKGLLYIAELMKIPIDAGMREKIGQWDIAYKVYTKELASNPKNKEIKEKSLNCLHHLLQYEKLRQEANNNQLYKVIASWHLFDLKNFAIEASKLQIEDKKSLFYSILLDLMNNNFDEIDAKIEQYRDLICHDTILSISDDYERNLSMFSNHSLLYDIESVLQYKKIQKEMETADYFDKKTLMEQLEQNKNQWKVRFDNSANISYNLYEHLCVRQLVMSRKEMSPHFQRLIRCLLSSKQIDAAKTILNISDAFDETEKQTLQSEILWAEGKSNDALKLLNNVIKKDGQNLDLRLLSGEWSISSDKLIEAKEILAVYLNHTVDNSKAWHLFYRANLLLSKSDPKYLIPSFSASLNGLILGTNEGFKLNFVLAILPILFYQNNKEVYKIFKEKMHQIPTNSWFDVLPQIIARMNTQDLELREIVEKLLCLISDSIPHSVLYSLFVPLRSSNQDRQISSTNVLNQLRTKFPQMVNKTIKFTNELIRVAASWFEIYRSRVDEATRAFFLNNDYQRMVNILTPLFSMLSEKPETLYEVSFSRAYTSKLFDANKWFNRYLQTNDLQHLQSSVSILSSVYQSITPLIHSLKTIQLEDVSPSLADIHNETDLAMPGQSTLSHGEKSNVFISSIDSEVNVLMSIQHPRKIKMIGSDGNKYTFLLKAHEDTRLDQRVMQYFKLINTIIEHQKWNSLPLKNHLSITTYKVIPLANEVGLIGWVQNCTTIYSTIVQYRKDRGLDLSIERDACYKTAGSEANYLNMDVKAKVQAFIRGCSETPGNEIQNTLLHYSENSEHWLKRRTSYTATLALTSFAGYILGLGDRHCDNIMIDNTSAKLVHIDFGECFEETFHRKVMPERVPFRLTRMLQNALEVSKIEGTFRTTCENVMKLLRKNKEQILGLLDVFKYDPLLQWIISNEIHGIKTSTAILLRIEDKLNGKDFSGNETLDVPTQVDRLINQAVDNENLCQMFAGWNPWW